MQSAHLLDRGQQQLMYILSLTCLMDFMGWVEHDVLLFCVLFS